MALALFENIGLALASGVPAYMEAKKLAMDAREAAQQRRAAKVMAALEGQEFAAKNRLEEMKRISEVFYDTYKVVPGADGQYSVPDLFGNERVLMTPEQRDYRLNALDLRWRNMAEGFREDFPQYENAVYLLSPRDQAVQMDLSMGGDLGMTGEPTPETAPEMEPTGTGFDFEGAGERFQQYLPSAMRLFGQGLNMLRYFTPVGPGSMETIGPEGSDSWMPEFVQSVNPLQWGAPGPAPQPDTLGPNAIEPSSIILPEEEEPDRDMPRQYRP
jgi:hypothetical protein